MSALRRINMPCAACRVLLICTPLSAKAASLQAALRPALLLAGAAACRLGACRAAAGAAAHKVHLPHRPHPAHHCEHGDAHAGVSWANALQIALYATRSRPRQACGLQASSADRAVQSLHHTLPRLPQQGSHSPTRTLPPCRWFDITHLDQNGLQDMMKGAGRVAHRLSGVCATGVDALECGPKPSATRGWMMETHCRPCNPATRRQGCRRPCSLPLPN